MPSGGVGQRTPQRSSQQYGYGPYAAQQSDLLAGHADLLVVQRQEGAEESHGEEA
jgi:hypothetical protein